jgi:hypothetical protein
MVWQKIDDQFGVSKKVIRIPKRRRQQCIGLWTLAGNYAVRALTDGVLEEHELAELEARQVDIDELVRVGLWHAHGHDCRSCMRVSKGAIVIHDFLAYNPSREKVESDREAERVRKAAQRDRRRSPEGSPSGTPAGSDPVSEHPVPSRPSPDPSTTDTHIRLVTETPAEASTDDRMPVDNSAHWASFGITDIGAVQRAIVSAIGHPISEQDTGRIVGWIMAKAETSGTKPRSMQAYVLGSVKKSWAEVEQYWHEEVAS